MGELAEVREQRMEFAAGARAADDAPSPGFLDALDHPAALLDLDAQIVAVNPAWTRFGKDNGGGTGRFRGLNYLGICDATEGAECQDARRVADGLRAVLAGERRSFDHTYPCHAPNRRRWFKMVASRIGTTVLVLHVDVTGEYQALPAHSLADHYAELAHDLMNPLNALIGFIALARCDIADQVEAGRLQRHVDLAAESAEILQEMFVDIMHAGRDGGDGLPDQRASDAQSLAVSDLLREVCLIQGCALGSVSLDVDDRLPDGTRLVVETVPLKRIVQNTISNAIKYNRPNGRVTVSLALNSGGGVEIRVDDTGIGIAEDDIPHVFEKYRRVGDAAQNGGGYGIGLSVVKELTEAYDGMVTVASTLDVGTSVTIVFPAWRTVR